MTFVISIAIPSGGWGDWQRPLVAPLLIGQLRARTRDRQRIDKRRKAHIRAIHARKHISLC